MEGDDEKAIRGIVARYVDAWNRTDPAALASLYAEQGDFVSSTGDRASGRAEIERWYDERLRQGYFSETTLDFDAGSIRFVRPDIAILEGRWVISGARDLEGHSSTVRQGTITVFLEKRDGRWLIDALRSLIALPMEGRRSRAA
jgi:uncharacterized protein (TIGR02246 family)